MIIKECYICKKRSPAIENHHIILQASGGKQGPTVDLCSNCHSLVHKQALNAESKAQKVLLFTNEEWIRAKRIVDYIILSLRKNRDRPDFNDPYNLQVKMTKGEVALLHMIKDQSGYSNLNSYVRDLLRAHIRSKYPKA